MHHWKLNNAVAWVPLKVKNIALETIGAMIKTWKKDTKNIRCQLGLIFEQAHRYRGTQLEFWAFFL